MTGVEIIVGIALGVTAYVLLRALMMGFFTVAPNERAVLTSFGRAQRIGRATTLDTPLADELPEVDRERYRYPQLHVIGPGGPYFRWPWQRVHKVNVAISTASIAFDPESPEANQGGLVLEAVTQDQLNIGLSGQIRFSVSEGNLYAFLFGVKNPIAHVMGYFISVLRERIANFKAPREDEALVPEDLRFEGISINDLRKNVNLLNEQMDLECRSSAARYGIMLDASLITGIDPPHQIESALAAINTAHNEVSSEVSVAQALADQRIEESKRAVEIQTMKAEAEVEPLRWLAEQLQLLKQSGPEAIPGYLRNVRLDLYKRAKRIILDMGTMSFLLAFLITLIACIILVPLLTALGKFFCLFAIVQECEAHVFLLFGRVVGIIDEPGLHLLAFKIGPHALLIRFFGGVRRVDLRLDQEYLRSEPVNSEEGTPMGIGVWYEMRVSNPADYLFRNTDPRGSLRANVRNATVRCLSNMPLQNLLEDRHKMSRRVREEVSLKSEAWGFHLGSVYIRKVHFRDDQMIHQIEQKVVNRLRQVTSAIRQQGANQVAIIKSGAERTAATEFAHAAAVRPYLVGKAIQEIAKDKEILDTVFRILETEKMLDGDVDLTLVPRDSLFARLLATDGAPLGPAPAPQ